MTVMPRLTLIPEGRVQSLRPTLIDRCCRLNDPPRASQLLADTHIKKRIYIAAPSLDRLAQVGSLEAVSKYNASACGQDGFMVESAALDDTGQLAGGLDTLARLAQIMVVYSVWPGRSSYSVFVEAQPPEAVTEDAVPGGGGPGDARLRKEAPGQPRETPSPPLIAAAKDPTQQLANGPNGLNDQDIVNRPNRPSHHQLQQQHHEDHQARLFEAALHGILELPHPPGPARLAFSAIPAHAAPVMLSVLRDAGYDTLWDEPCYRYCTRSLRPSPSISSSPRSAGKGPSEPSGGQRRAEQHGEAAPSWGAPAQPVQPPQPRPLPGQPQYVLDRLHSEADARLVNSLWSYRSPYSLPLIRLLIAHGNTVCVRLPPSSPPSPPSPPRAATFEVPRVGGTHVVAPGPEPGLGSTAPGTKCKSGTSSGSESDAVAWILQYPDGSLGLAHTLPPHRRRGLMRTCAREMTGRVLLQQLQQQEQQQQHRKAAAAGAVRGQREPEVFTYIVRENGASVVLFEGLGFRRDPRMYHWLGVEGSEGGAEEVRSAEAEAQQQPQEQRQEQQQDK